VIHAAPAMTVKSSVRRPVLLVILDGFGFNERTEDEILTEAAARIPTAEALAMAAIARQQDDQQPGPSLGGSEALLRLVLSPVLPTTALAQDYAEVPYERLQAVREATRRRLAETPAGEATLLEAAEAVVTEVALEKRYAVWSARSNYLNELRNRFPTVATQASGLAAGYEDVIPAVQGNSETGHQQIGNFVVAAQTPLEISSDIVDGSFFRNRTLLQAIEEVRQRETALNICFLLSGEYGNDGRVHSAWNHLEALLEAIFTGAKLPPSRVNIEAITDGRDSPAYSSVRAVGQQYGFLYKLKTLLGRYGAEESLAWVIGRSIAMDRDYEEARTKQDFQMLVASEGQYVPDFDAAIEAVRAFHGAGGTDPNVPPIVVGPARRTIGVGDVFIDMNFRADRQRAKVASLLGARDFLAREAGKKGQTWKMDWLTPPKNLSVYCLSEYHPDLASKYGARVLYPIRPQAHNLFAVVPEQAQAQGFAFKYLLTAESTKALHVGYFIRGRREEPVVAEEETRTILPSYGSDYGVSTDDDYYKTPQMRAFALADVVVEALIKGEYDLIAVNLANTDMVGHLMPQRWDAAERSITLVDTVLATMVPAAIRSGFDTIITADHGNVEDNDSSHTANDVLTTFVSPDGAIELREDPRRRARLFDLPWSIVELMGLSDAIIPNLPTIPAGIREQGLVGRCLIRIQAPVAPAKG
jgi:2,3-bisphosphoglycerate-independent phosphoglycerate mutase